MNARRPGMTPAQLQRLLGVLSAFGFSPRRVEVAPDGTLTLHAEAAAAAERDLLAEWEVGRAARVH